MSNMSYCRFRNTVSDFDDCANALANREELSEDEQEAAKRLIKAAYNLLNGECLLHEGDLVEESVDALIDECKQKDDGE